MVKVEVRNLEARPDEILVGNVAYPRSINPPVFSEGLDTQGYVLNTWDDGNFALSGSQMFNGLSFDPMTEKALGEGQFLARVRDVTPFLRDVNLAQPDKDGNVRGVIYDTTGKRIEGDRLIQLGDFINNAWVYLNDRFEKGSGFKGLDVTHLVGRDRDRLIVERQPLEDYITGWADVQGEINSQGYFTQRAPVQQFERGKTIYQHEPVAGRVVRLDADSSRASLDADRDPQIANPLLGGILRAEGTPRKIEGEEK